MEKAMRRTAKDPDRTLRTALLWAGAIKLMLILNTANAEMVSYQVPTSDLVRQIEREQAWEQQQRHEMAVAAYRDAQARHMEEAIYEMRPIEPRRPKYRLITCTEPKPQQFVQAQSPWNPPANPPGPPSLVPPSRSQVLMQRREELARQAERTEVQLRALHEDTERRQEEIHRQLRQIHDQIAGVDEELAQLERQRRERQQRLLAEAQEQTERLSDQARSLQTQAHEIQQTLGQMSRNNDIPSPPPTQVHPPMKQQRSEPLPPTGYQPMIRPMDDRTAENEATRKFREELRRELDELHGANEYTNRMLERLLHKDHPCTVGSAW